jgi:hypothetical protein
LISNGEYDQAIIDLSAYQTDSLSILTGLKMCPWINVKRWYPLCWIKLKDIKLMRVIASILKLPGGGYQYSMLEQMSMMVLSLKKRFLTFLLSLKVPIMIWRFNTMCITV